MITNTTWKKFCETRDRFLLFTDELVKRQPNLLHWEQELADQRGGPMYRVETPVVFNRALEEITPSSTIKMILVADNPGRIEQAAVNKRYLIGMSGKIADGFFKKNAELGINFRSDVIILNKTPIHTPRTGELLKLRRLGGDSLAADMEEAQREMASLLFEFHKIFNPVMVWITGYSEMKKGGIFEVYTDAIRESYGRNLKMREDLFVYRHFSMNQFVIDLKKKALQGEEIACTLKRIGAAYREKIFE